MKNHSLLIFALLVSACSQTAELYRDSTETLGLSPAYDRIDSSTPATATPQKAPPDMADGEQTIAHSSGRYMKTVVRNGILDDYADVYYPNGQLHSHTPLKAGIPQGWSSGYRSDGSQMSRLLYQNGHIIRWQRFDEQGKLIQEGSGAPQ